MLRPLILCGLLLLTGAACAEDSTNSDAVGDLRVVIHTTGANPDTNGYTLTVDGVGSGPVAMNDTVSYNGLPINDYAVNLTDVAGNCSVSGGAFKTRYVGVGTNSTPFDVTCP